MNRYPTGRLAHACAALVALTPAVAFAQSTPASATANQDAPVFRCGTVTPTYPIHNQPPQHDQPVIQIALLLDTSNSMDGLIDQAKSQLWAMVNQFNTAHHHGRRPRLEVAVFEYGNNSLPASEQYVRQVVGLTGDLDRVSQALFTLRTNGGSEYCGAAIHEAVNVLNWSSNPDGYRAIFIAGNEPFTQGSLHFRQAIGGANARNVIVNTIHCGDEAQGRNGQWHEGARLGNGRYMNINTDLDYHRRIQCPQDDRIAQLTRELNDTYAFYGQRRGALRENQLAQTENAEQMGGSASAARAQTMAGGRYDDGVAESDAVEYFRRNGELPAAPADELPADMQAMTDQEREAHVRELLEQRTRIQQELQQLTAERQAHYDAEVQRLREEENVQGDDLGTVLEQTVLDQAAANGFEFSEPQSDEPTPDETTEEAAE